VEFELDGTLRSESALGKERRGFSAIFVGAHACVEDEEEFPVPRFLLTRDDTHGCWACSMAAI
jgi:hypothetical protein